ESLAAWTAGRLRSLGSLRGARGIEYASVADLGRGEIDGGQPRATGAPENVREPMRLLCLLAGGRRHLDPVALAAQPGVAGRGGEQGGRHLVGDHAPRRAADRIPDGEGVVRVDAGELLAVGAPEEIETAARLAAAQLQLGPGRQVNHPTRRSALFPVLLS